MKDRTGRLRVAFAPMALTVMIVLVVGVPRAAQAQATPPSVTVGDDRHFVKNADGTSTLTATVTVTGVDRPTVVSIRIGGTDPEACTPLVQPVLRPGVQTKVAFDLPATCALPDAAKVELFTLPFATGSSTGVQVEAKVSAKPSPDYWNLGRGFGLGALIALVGVVLAWWLRVGEDLKPDQPGRWSHNPWQRLKGLDTKWSWTDSPLSSVTVAGAVFTAVLGASDPLKTILGDGGARDVAVIVVAAALATALIAAAPLSVALFRDEDAAFDQGQIPNNYTVLGVLIATVAVATGSLGLISTIVFTLWDSTSVNTAVLAIAAVLVGSFVVAYTVRAMRRTLKIGMARTPTTEKSAVEPAFAAMP